LEAYVSRGIAEEYLRELLDETSLTGLASLSSIWQRKRALILVAGVVIATSLLASALIWLPLQSAKQRPAPKAQAILEHQAKKPFQILIPAYLPAGFQRKDLEIRTDLTGSQGGPMVQLIIY
jgi:hypothetical protein